MNDAVLINALLATGYLVLIAVVFDRYEREPTGRLLQLFFVSVVATGLFGIVKCNVLMLCEETESLGAFDHYFMAGTLADDDPVQRHPGGQVQGEDAWKNPGMYRRVGLVPERESVYPYLSGREFVRLSPGALDGVAQPIVVVSVETALTGAVDRPGGHVDVAPTVLGQADTPGFARNVALVDDLALIADRGAGRRWRAAVGQTIPHRAHWAVAEKLGEGGFGEVWLARHAKTGERRVFKFSYDPARRRALGRGPRRPGRPRARLARCFRR